MLPYVLPSNILYVRVLFLMAIIAGRLQVLQFICSTFTDWFDVVGFWWFESTFDMFPNIATTVPAFIIVAFKTFVSYCLPEPCRSFANQLPFPLKNYPIRCIPFSFIVLWTARR